VNLDFKLKTEQLEIVEMFWQVFALVFASLNNTVAIADQFENTD
jgi:hypothetical protein